MLSDDELLCLMLAREADNVERTTSRTDRDKFGEAICAFANDLPDRRKTGVLFIGVHDDGKCANTLIDGKLEQTLMGFRTDGTISPFPFMSVHARELNGCRVLIVEVEPSTNPPLRYRGRTCVRTGSRRGYATAEEERRLVEKRRWGALPFEQQPMVSAGIGDLDALLFQAEILPATVHSDVLAENHRDVAQQMEALRYLHPSGLPTAVGLLVCGKDPISFLPGAYVQFVRYPGITIGEEIADSRIVTGPISALLRLLDDIIDLNIANRANLSGRRQRNSPTYPAVALQELVRNAVIHRNYEGTAAPVRISWFDDRVEITSPGGPYGSVTLEKFGEPGPTDYRNPALADAARALGFVQKFGSGILRARTALQSNGNPPPRFQAEPTYVNVTVWAAP
jgi:ATP-dependent DNA helicase RecG